MSGIDTSKGINSVASQIATLEANQTQSVQTNTGATVTGLAAAAYEFGSILASYPADAPPLTQSAPVFQVTNADGSTSMVSLSDLANDIQKQTGFDPLLEFSAGIGFTNQGYSLSDINYVLNSLQTQFPGQMTFTQLAQVEGNQALNVSNNLDSQVQGAVSDLQSALSNSQSYINQALAASPGGVSLDASIIFDPISATGAPDATALAQLPALSQTIAIEQTTVNADQALYNYDQNNFSPADQAAIVAAQSQIAGSNPITGVNGIAPSASFITELQAGLNQLTTAMSPTMLQDLANNSNGTAFMSANNLLAGNHDTGGEAGWYSVTFYNDYSKAFNGVATIAQFASDAQAAGYNWGSTGPDGRLYGIGASNQNTTTIGQLGVQKTVDNSTSTVDINFQSGQIGHGNTNIFSGLMQSCGCDPTNATQVAQFNAQLNKLIPGASSKPYFTAQDILNLQNLVNAIQTAQTHQTTAVNTAYQRLQNDSNKLTSDQTKLNNLMSSAMASTAPAAVSLQNSINALASANGTIAGYQSAIVSIQQQMTTALNNQTLANTLESKLATTAAALATDPTNTSKQADHATALSAIQMFLGGTYATDADATAACEAYKTSQQGLISNPGGLQDQVTISQSTVKDYQTQLQSLQTQLLTLPNSSFRELLADIQTNTGIDMAAALKPVIGDGPLTLGNLNQVYQYINQNLPNGATPFPILTNDQLIQAASQQVLSLFNQPAFTQALANSPNGVDPNAALFTVPGSNTPISFNAALNLIAQSSGVNVTSSINAILQGGQLTQQVVTGINSFINNPPAAGGVKPDMGVQLTDPATGQQVSISGAKAAEFTFAQQLNRIDFTALAAAGSPISADAPIFISSDANGNPVDISLNQLIQNYVNQGYNMTGLLPAGANSFTMPDVAAMLDRLNVDQTEAVFKVPDNAWLNAGLLQIKALANSDSATNPDTVQNGLNLLNALGVPNPQQMYFQAVFAAQLDNLDQTPGLGYIATNNGEFWSSDALSDTGQALDSLQPLMDQLGISFGPISDRGYTQSVGVSKPTWESELNATSLNALITQLNAANAGTPFNINNPYANTPGAQDTSRYGQVGFTAYQAPQAESNFASNLSSNFAVFDMTKVPPLAMSNVNAPAEIADDLNNFNVDPRVQGALDFLRQALSQINSQDLDAYGNLSMSNAVFNMPVIAQSLGEPASTPVSLSQIMAYATEATGANLSQAIPNLADANGNISFNNVNSLINILNQAVPPATANATACLNLANFLSPQAPPIQTQYGSIGLNFNQWSQSLNANLLGTAITGCTCETALYSDTLAGQLGIPQNRIAASASADVRTAAENSQLALITQKLSQLVPNFQAPATADGWTAATIANLQAQLQAAAGPQPIASLGAGGVDLAKAIQVSENLMSNATIASSSNNSIGDYIAGYNKIFSGTTYSSPAGILLSDEVPAQSYMSSAVIGISYVSNYGITVGGNDLSAASYANSIAGILGIPQPNGPATQAMADSQYQLVQAAIKKVLPNFSFPVSANLWTPQDVTRLITQLSITTPPQQPQAASLQSSLYSLAGVSIDYNSQTATIGSLLRNAWGNLNLVDDENNVDIQNGLKQNSTVALLGALTGVPFYTTNDLLGQGGNTLSAASYSNSIAGILGIPQPQPTGRASLEMMNSQYQLVQDAVHKIDPGITFPSDVTDLRPEDIVNIVNSLSTALNHSYIKPPLDLTTVKTNLQNISFENVATAVQTGQATAAVTASFEQRIDQNTVPVLTAAEMDAQLQAGSLYVNKHGQFFLNRQPTNARDASVAAFVIGGNSLSSKLNNLMNDVNTRNTHVQILNYLSAATSASDLATRIQTEKSQYGYADILSEVTGGALTDASSPGSDSDVLGTTGTFQSTLKTAIDNATKNQDLDTQNLQSLTTQIQSNNTAMTQLLQAYEQLLKSVAQNFE